MNTVNCEIKSLVDCQQHIPALAKLWYEEISRHWVPNASIDRNLQGLVDHLNRNTLPIACIALQDGKPVGMACLRDTDGIMPGVGPWLGSLIVDPRYRNQKIGERLIDAVKAQAKILGYPLLYLLAFDATIPGWYTRLGWEPIGEDKLFGHQVAVMRNYL